MGSQSTFSDENTFKIMLATDIHLGYNERDQMRAMDSFNSFEEILQLAQANEVDFILLGGDLFHHSKPSPFAFAKCTELLKRYCLGDRPIMIELISDPAMAFEQEQINYEDPNLNVSIPVFTIHGNHDDPAADSHISSIDILSASGLVNYFGKWKDMTKIEISPIGLKKGETKLAIYGLSHIRDERLGRLFREKRIMISMPQGDNFFHLLVLHQNREERGPKNFIPATYLPSFIDFVVWGHEHECRIDPEPVGDTYVCQPGSSVATSLSIGESVQKKVGILEICGTDFRLTPIELKSVRPFKFHEIYLLDDDDEKYDIRKPEEQAMKTIDETMTQLIQTANDEQLDPNDPDKELMLPLIRLIVRYNTMRQQCNTVKLGRQYQGKIANPENCIVFKAMKKNKVAAGKITLNTRNPGEPVPDWVKTVPELVAEYLAQNNNPLQVLSVEGCVEALTRIQSSEDTEALEMLVNYQSKKTIEKLMEKNTPTSTADYVTALEELKNERNGVEENVNLQKFLDEGMRPQNETGELVQKDIASTEEESDRDASILSTRGRGRGSRGGRAATRARGRGRGRGRGAASTDSKSDIQGLDSFVTSISTSRGRASTRRKAAPSTSRNMDTITIDDDDSDVDMPSQDTIAASNTSKTTKRREKVKM